MKLTKKKIAIVTWYNSGRNYGQTLQAYALQTTLKLRGYYVETLTYGYGVYSKIIFLNNAKRRKAAGNDRECQKLFDRFIQTYMKVSKPLCSVQDVENYLNKKKFDVVICGSDQIWNPYNVDPVYYLSFDGNYRKIAYAPSVIAERFVNKFDEYPQVKEWIQDLDYISVREQTGAKIINKISGIMPKVVLDPTLLLSCDEWEKIIEKRKNHESYIFCYLFNMTESQKQFVCALSKRLKGIEIIYADILVSEREDIKTVKDMSIEEFLSLIRYADAVVTDSFHGTVFSILFQRDFYVVDNGVDEDCDKYYNIDRMQTLLATVGLEERLLSDTVMGNVESVQKIDYNQVEMKLGNARNDSMSYLIGAIERE